jgi:hypothetical protein
MTASLPCPACKGALNRAEVAGRLPQTCPWCRQTIQVEWFPAADLPDPPLEIGEPLVTGEEAACFHHADRRAVNLCADCGRFLCRLCDIEVENTHFCATCLERKRKEGREPRWVTGRVLYDEMALFLAIAAWLGLVFLSPLALALAWRQRHAPSSLLHRRNWRIYLSLVLAILHVLTLITVGVWFVVNWLK